MQYVWKGKTCSSVAMSLAVLAFSPFVLHFSPVLQDAGFRVFFGIFGCEKRMDAINKQQRIKKGWCFILFWDKDSLAQDSILFFVE